MVRQQAQNQGSKQYSSRTDNNPLIGNDVLKFHSDKLWSHHAGMTLTSQGKNRTAQKVVNNMTKEHPQQ